MRSVEPKALAFEFVQAGRRVLVALKLDPALRTARGVVELWQSTLDRHRVRAHHADGVAGAQDGRDIVRFVDPFHEHGQIRLARGRDGFDSGFASRVHAGMVAAMRHPRPVICRLLPVLLTLSALLAPLPSARAQAVDAPDFATLTDLIAESVQSSGPAPQTGDRAELYRFTPDGWEVQMFAVWSGYRWLLLAVHVHHPSRSIYGQGEWQSRYAQLLTSYSPDWVERLRLPDLFEVPPPDYNPAVPDEVRSRRFVWQGYWYDVRWFNIGGVDDDAEWELVSYDLVALEPPSPEDDGDGDGSG